MKKLYTMVMGIVLSFSLYIGSVQASGESVSLDSAQRAFEIVDNNFERHRKVLNTLIKRVGNLEKENAALRKDNQDMKVILKGFIDYVEFKLEKEGAPAVFNKNVERSF